MDALTRDRVLRLAGFELPDVAPRVPEERHPSGGEEVRHRELQLLGISTRPVPPLDDETRALIEALECFGETRTWSAAEAAKHPRNKAGTPGGGRFRSVFQRITDALESWAKGDGPEDPFEGFKREQLREAAKKLGLPMRPRMSEPELKNLLFAHMREKVGDAKAAKSPEAGKPVRFTLTGAKHRDLDVGVHSDNGKVALWEVSDSGERRRRVALVPDLAGLAKWADDNGEAELADWARKERGGDKTPAAKAGGTTFDESKAKSFFPTRVVKQARIMDVPDGEETVITPEWGGEQRFKGRWVAVLNDSGDVAYGSAYDEWVADNERVPGDPNGWVKTAKVQAYRHTGAPKPVRTVLADGTVETTNTAQAGDWIVKQRGGEVQVVSDAEFRKRYQVDANGQPLRPLTQKEMDELRETATYSFHNSSFVRPTSAAGNKRVDNLIAHGFMREENGQLFVTDEGRRAVGQTPRGESPPATKAAKKAAPSQDVMTSDKPQKATAAASTVDLTHLRTLDPEAARDELDLLKVGTVDDPTTLKGLLKAQGLPVSGKKRDLVDRLVEHLGQPSREERIEQLMLAGLTRDEAEAQLGGKAVRPSGLPADRKPESGDFDDLAERISARSSLMTKEQRLEILKDLNASELRRLAAKFPGGFKISAAGNLAVRYYDKVLRIPDGLTLDERREWLAEQLSQQRFHWRSAPLDDEGDVVRAEDTDYDDEDLTDDDAPSPDEVGDEDEELDDDPDLDTIQSMADEDDDERMMRPEARARELALLGVTRAAGQDITPGHDQLHHYWTRGEGLAKWASSPRPWRTLHALVTKAVRKNGRAVSPEQIKRWVSRWFIEVFGYAAGSDKNRVAHGRPPRGKRVGPG